MNTTAINSAADVILAALTQNRTATGIALALDSAQMLLTPEAAAELNRLRERVAELEQAAACQSVASVNGARCCLPVRHRGDHRTEDKRQYWDDAFAVPPPARAERSAERLRSLLADQRESLEDPHDSPLWHSYLKGRELPEVQR